MSFCMTSHVDIIGKNDQIWVSIASDMGIKGELCIWLCNCSQHPNISGSSVVADSQISRRFFVRRKSAVKILASQNRRQKVQLNISRKSY